MKHVILAIAALMLLSSCYTSRIVAPVDSKVTVANEMEQLPIKVRYKQVYALFGLIPLANIHTDDRIQRMKLTKIRMTTKQNFIDGLIAFLTSGLIVTQTAILEGESSASYQNTNTSTIVNDKSKSKADRLKELKEMLDAKLISNEDYEREKKKILEEK